MAAAPEKSELIRSLETSLGSPLSTEPLRPHPRPLVVVVSGPSGVGKDAVIRRLREVREGLHFVVTATTRPMRPGEVNGVDYFFVTESEFVRMIEADELLEHAVVYGDRKGIPRGQIRDFMARGHDVVLRVDIQGAETLRRVLGDAAVFVFVSAPSEAEMAARLAARGTESASALAVRVAAAREEVKRLREFDYVVVNREGELDSAVSLLGSIMDAEKAKVRQRTLVV